MPVEEATNAQRWQREHPQEMVWCLTNDATSFGQNFAATGLLDAIDGSDVFAQICDGTSGTPTASAEAWDALEIPNGDYTVVYRGEDSNHLDGETFYFRVYLVQGGQLSGKRIVKVRHGQNGLYKGFGFLNKNGTFSLWRRYAHDAEAQYVKVFELAAQLLHSAAANAGSFASEFISERFVTDASLHLVDAAGLRSVRIGYTAACTLCNEAVYTEGFTSPVPLCPAHVPRQEDPTEEEARLEEERRAESERRAAEIMSNLPMSQIGDGTVQ